MENSAKKIVDKMLEGFAASDVDKIVETVSEDTVWLYHGTHIIPKAEFRGKEGVRKFFANIFERTEMIKFEPEQYIVQDNVVVIRGNEHQKTKRSGRELKQKWVQLYTVENGLISRMEEFAASVEVNQP